VFQVVLYLKDEESVGKDECYKLHYYAGASSLAKSGGQEDTELFGLPATNLYKNSESLQKITKILHLLSQFNVYLDLGIEGNYYPSIKENVFTLVDGAINNEILE